MSENKSLTTIAQEVNALEVLLLESAGEVTPEIEAALTVKEVNLPHKVDSYSFVLERFDSLEKFYRERAALFTNAARTFANAKDTLKERLKIAMDEMNVTELSGHDVRFKLSASKPALVITDVTKIPKDYFVQVISDELQKDKLSEDLKIGAVEGAELRPSYSLRTYANGPAKLKKGKKDE